MLPVMPKLSKHQNVSSEPTGAADVNLGRSTVAAPTDNPKRHAALVETGLVTTRATVAANAGTGINSKLLRAFDTASIGEAEWLRLPSPRARCRLTGFSRTGLNELIDAKLIRAIKVRKAGAQRGVVLISRASLLNYLAKLDAEQNGTTATEARSRLSGLHAGKRSARSLAARCRASLQIPPARADSFAPGQASGAATGQKLPARVAGVACTHNFLKLNFPRRHPRAVTVECRGRVDWHGDNRARRGVIRARVKRKARRARHSQTGEPFLHVGSRYRVHADGKPGCQLCQPDFQIFNVTRAGLAVRFQGNQFVGNFTDGARRAFGGIAADIVLRGLDDFFRAENLHGLDVARGNQFKGCFQSGVAYKLNGAAIACGLVARSLAADVSPDASKRPMRCASATASAESEKLCRRRWPVV